MRTRCLCVACAVLLSCGPQADAPTPRGTSYGGLPLEASEGETIYHALCWACHGHGGHGDGPAADSLGDYRPPTFHTRDLASAIPARLERLFLTGLTDEPEHPHALYVLPVLRREALPDAMAYVSRLTHPPDVPGSAVGGRERFDALCAPCHGPDGRGGGAPRTFMTDQDPADLTRLPMLLEGRWTDFFAALKEGSSEFHGVQTPAWGVVLRDAELWDLVAYLATLRTP